MPWYLRYPNLVFAFFVAMLQKTPAQGAWNTVYVATCPLETLVSGAYWVNRQSQAKQPCALDDEAADRLWKISAQLVGVPEEMDKTAK